MKQSKRLVALLLGLLICFGLGLPAFAQADPAMPVITEQPKGATLVANSESMFADRTEIKHILSVKAHIPNGDPVGYRWYKNGGRLYDWSDTLSQVEASNTKFWAGEYYIEVFNRDNPEISVKSKTVRVVIDQPPPPTFWETFAETFIKTFFLFCGWPLTGVLISSFGGPGLMILVGIFAVPLSVVLAVPGLIVGLPWALVQAIAGLF